VAQALPSNLVEDCSGSGSFTPLSFSFTDGFNVDTDSSNLQVGPDLDVYYDGKVETQEGICCNCAPEYCGYGTWTSTVTSALEPGSFVLFGSGLVGLTGLLLQDAIQPENRCGSVGDQSAARETASRSGFFSYLHQQEKFAIRSHGLPLRTATATNAIGPE